MAFDHDESLYNQSSLLRINVMVVDDDPIFLQVMSRMLEKSTHTDPSLMEITVLAARDSMEALSTLKTHRNNIDLIITDYYMPGMNGIQLKKQITQEFGNLPVIVMSSDANKEEESLTCGAMCFIPKPINPNDLTKIYEYALTYKRNGKSIMSTEQNHKDTDVNVPQQIEMRPDVANALVTTKTKKKYSSGSDSKSVNTNGSCVSTDGSKQNLKRKPNGGCGDDEPRPSKKSKVTWTDDLHDLFLQAIRHIGLDKAVPKKILEFMNIPYLTRENVASHLQKYRIFLRKVADQGLFHSNLLPGRSIREPYYNYYTPSTSWYETSLNNRSFYSKPGLGLGQSRLLSSSRETVRFNQPSSYSYMNRSSVYEPHRIGSNSTLPIKSNLNISNQPSQNEGRRSFFEPTVMANKTAQQTSQVVRFGQNGPSAINGNSLNSDMMSSYGSLTPTQPSGLSTFASSTPNQSRVRNFGCSTPNQPGLNNYGASTPNQSGVSSFGTLTPNQPGLNSYGTSTPNQPGLNSYGTSTPNQSGVSSFRSLTPNQPGLGNSGSLTPNQPIVCSFGSLTPTQSGVSNFGSSTPSQQGFNSYGSLTCNQSGVSSFGSSTPNQPGLSSFGTLTPNQSGGVSSFGSLTPNQSGGGSFGSSTPNQPELSSFGSLTPNQPGTSNFSFDIQSFLNNESEAYNPPQAQPNLEIPQLENLNIFDDLGSIYELPCETSNFYFDNNKQQEEADSNKFDLPDLPAQLNQSFPLEEDFGGDWTFVNTNQGHFDGETSNNFAAPEMDLPNFNMNPTQNQEQDDLDFIDWSFLERQDSVGEGFMDSVFNNDMN